MLRYSAGIMIFSKEHPLVISYRSEEPVLTPELPCERHGIVANVVFPTGIDRRDDLGMPDRFDIYYGWPTTVLVWLVLTCRITSRQGRCRLTGSKGVNPVITTPGKHGAVQGINGACGLSQESHCHSQT